MLGLSVERQDGTALAQSGGAPIFYDEKLRIRVDCPHEADVHLCVTVAGSFEEHGREHSVVIFDETLEWAPTRTEDVHIRHPRSPLQSPHLEIVATARFSAAASGPVPADRAKYLQAFEPVELSAPSAIVPFRAAPQPAARAHARGASTSSGINFAEAYEERRNSATGETVRTRRRERPPAPAPSNRGAVEQDADIRVVRWRHALSQALELEIRSIRPALERDRVIAEIDLVAGAFPVEVSACDVTLDDGIVDLMGSVRLPLSLDARGKLALCFNLQVRAAPQPLHVPVSRRPLNIALECTVGGCTVGERAGGERASADASAVAGAAPRITTMWTPLVDFEGTQGPLPKTPALTLPANSPLAPAHHAGSVPPSASSSTLDLVGTGARSQVAKTNLGLMGGVSIIVTGPQFVTVGDTFEWSFKVLNRSQRARMFTFKFAGSAPRDAAMHDSRAELPVPTNASITSHASQMSVLSMPSPDQLRRRAQAHYSSIGASKGIIPLGKELRIGNLAPHTCFETTLELYAHKPGTHSVESTKIEDLSNRDSYDVGGLLEVIVLPKA